MILVFMFFKVNDNYRYEIETFKTFGKDKDFYVKKKNIKTEFGL